MYYQGPSSVYLQVSFSMSGVLKIILVHAFFFSLLLYQRYSSVGPCSWTDAFILDLVFCHQFCLVSRRQVQILSRIFVCYLIPYLSTHLRKVWLIKASFSLATDCSTYMSDQLTKGYRPNLQATAEQCYCLQKPCRGLFS